MKKGKALLGRHGNKSALLIAMPRNVFKSHQHPCNWDVCLYAPLKREHLLMKHPDCTTPATLPAPWALLFFPIQSEPPMSLHLSQQCPLVASHFWKSEAILRSEDKTYAGFSQLSWKSYLLRWSFSLCSGSAARWGHSAHTPLATAAREAKPSQPCSLQQ